MEGEEEHLPLEGWAREERRNICSWLGRLWGLEGEELQCGPQGWWGGVLYAILTSRAERVVEGGERAAEDGNAADEGVVASEEGCGDAEELNLKRNECVNALYRLYHGIDYIHLRTNLCIECPIGSSKRRCRAFIRSF